MEKFNKINIAEIIIGGVCGFVLFSNINIASVYLSAYVVLVLLSAGKIIVRDKKANQETFQEILFLIFACVFVMSLSYLLMLKLGIK